MNNHSILVQPCLSSIVQELQLTLNSHQISLLLQFDQFMIEKNMMMNLTRIIDPLDVAVKHFADSLILLKFVPFASGQKILDVGSGAGFPGLPIAICRPDLQVVLIDSLRKRTEYLREAASYLGLSNLSVYWGRAEELAHIIELREQFDHVLARAVAPLNVLLELCIPFVNRRGFFWAMKGPKACEEIDLSKTAMETLLVKLGCVQPYVLPISLENRSLICFSKSSFTPKTYPRRPGIPERQPL